jgi:photosystem II stability/assembly factor-like uncharacterized protein
VIGQRQFPLADAAVLAIAILLLAGCQSTTQPAPALDPSRPPQALAVDPSDGSLLKAASGVFRSPDQGRTWSAVVMPAELQPNDIQQVATTSAAPGTLFAAGPGAGVIRSDDDGRTWSTASGNLPSKDVSALAVHSFHPGTLYALITGGGIFRTEDGGDQWQKMDDGPRAKVLGLAHSTLPGSMNTGWLYAATEDGPYLSMDCF